MIVKIISTLGRQIDINIRPKLASYYEAGGSVRRYPVAAQR